MRLFIAIMHYDSYESEPLAVCTTLNKAKRLCGDKEDELGGLSFIWHDENGGSVGQGSHTYKINPIETNKLLR